ncbi:type II secretion system F family protein [candidate division KSB1 bacterium]|nr:type II secretion system F family protein [candidate division KSB1 bacterium]
MSYYLILGYVFVFVFLLVLTSTWIVRRKADPTLRRIKDLDKDRVVVGGVESDEEKARLRPAMQELFSRFANIYKQDEAKISLQRKKLVQAGYHDESSVRTYNGLKLVSSIAMFFLFLYLGLMGNKPVGLIVLLSLVVAVAGFKIPDFFITFQIRKRMEKIAGSLPDALDLLVITVEAGLGLNAAIQRVAADMKLRAEELAEEFMIVTQELRTGISREEALRNLTERNGVEDLRILVGALILTDKLGTSIASTLRAQSDSLRTRIQQKAEEQAAKAGVKMLLPLVMFILPALMIILMGPGIIAVYRTFQ